MIKKFPGIPVILSGLIFFLTLLKFYNFCINPKIPAVLFSQCKYTRQKEKGRLSVVPPKDFFFRRSLDYIHFFAKEILLSKTIQNSIFLITLKKQFRIKIYLPPGTNFRILAGMVLFLSIINKEFNNCISKFHQIYIFLNNCKK